EFVTPLAAEGKSVEEIEEQVPAPEDMHDWWRFTDWKHKKNIELISTFSLEGRGEVEAAQAT
ncbi:MAG: hypothetical protein JOZ57_05085, partial [Abitibacteriaceae bacterium]|nr:hypothetical protein [Abditibacteriaceae bacterium]